MGILGGEVVGVGVGGDEGGAGFVEGLEVGNDAAEGVEGLVGFQVADVLADEDLGAHGEGDGVLQVGADGEDRMANGRWPMADGRGELDWQRGVAAGAAQDQFAAHHHARDGVVHVPDDGAVVDEEQIGNAAEAFEGFVLVGANGLVAQVAARGHDGKAERGQEQVMQGGVGEHDAEVGVAGGEGGGQGWSVMRDA